MTMGAGGSGTPGQPNRLVRPGSCFVRDGLGAFGHVGEEVFDQLALEPGLHHAGDQAGHAIGGSGRHLGPQLLGHTAYNWSLRYVSATFVAVVTLGEPVGSALMAFIIFGEGFAPLQFVGFSLLLVGIYLAAKGEKG